MFCNEEISRISFKNNFMVSIEIQEKIIYRNGNVKKTQIRLKALIDIKFWLH